MELLGVIEVGRLGFREQVGGDGAAVALQREHRHGDGGFLLDQPGAHVVGVEPDAVLDVGKDADLLLRHGVGEDKRQEVRRLILKGAPHREVKERTGVSDGTISKIRGELRDEAVTVLRTNR